MTALREAAQQALEALEYAQQDRECPSTTRQVITALRTALTQPDDWTRCHHCGQSMPPVPLGQAEPAQEPVAVVRWNDIGHISWRTLVMLSDGTPLYTAPPRRTMVPLTDEEIDRIHLHLSSTVGSSYKTVARATEKASWEKNHG